MYSSEIGRYVSLTKQDLDRPDAEKIFVSELTLALDRANEQFQDKEDKKLALQ